MEYRVSLAAALLLMVVKCNTMEIDGEEMSLDDAIIKAGSQGEMSKMYDMMHDNFDVKVELDMLIPIDQYKKMREEMEMAEENDGKAGIRTKRKAIMPPRFYRWSKKRIPYEISYEFGSRDRETVMDAIGDYHKYTCIRFVPATSSDRNKIRFQNGGGCSSYVGMIGGSQPVSLARGCRYKGVIIHEMGHALGFQHEQTRTDRESYVTINTHNIQPGLEYNFMRYSPTQVSSYNVPYDYESVMHYSQYAYSKNGKPTIVARDPKYQRLMGNRGGLSFGDIHLANAMYDCSDGCEKRECPKGGFQGKDCKCYCDSGDRSNPLMECGAAPVVTTTTTTTTTERPTTTTTTTEEPTTDGCTNQNKYCVFWAYVGECSRNPGYMLDHCKKACNACDEKKVDTDCKDLSSYCPTWVTYCGDTLYRGYLERNCKRTCGFCEADNVQEIIKPEEKSVEETGESCRDIRGTLYCAGKLKKGHCTRSLIQYRCSKTCNAC